MEINHSINDAAHYLKTQLSIIPENYPEVETQLVQAWVEYMIELDYQPNDISNALKTIRQYEYAVEAIDIACEELEDYY